MRSGFKAATRKVQGLTDSVLDDELRELAASKAPPEEEAEAPSGESEMGEDEDELSPEKLEMLKALLSKG